MNNPEGLNPEQQEALRADIKKLEEMYGKETIQQYLYREPATDRSAKAEQGVKQSERSQTDSEPAMSGEKLQEIKFNTTEYYRDLYGKLRSMGKIEEYWERINDILLELSDLDNKAAADRIINYRFFLKDHGYPAEPSNMSINQVVNAFVGIELGVNPMTKP